MGAEVVIAQVVALAGAALLTLNQDTTCKIETISTIGFETPAVICQDDSRAKIVWRSDVPGLIRQADNSDYDDEQRRFQSIKVQATFLTQQEFPEGKYAIDWKVGCSPKIDIGVGLIKTDDVREIEQKSFGLLETMIANFDSAHKGDAVSAETSENIQPSRPCTDQERHVFVGRIHTSKTSGFIL